MELQNDSSRTTKSICLAIKLNHFRMRFLFCFLLVAHTAAATEDSLSPPVTTRTEIAALVTVDTEIRDTVLTSLNQTTDLFAYNDWFVESIYLIDLELLKLSNGKHIVTVEFANHDVINFIHITNNGITSELLGDELAFNNRKVKFRLPSVQIDIEAGGPQFVILQTFDAVVIDFMVSIKSQQSFTLQAFSSYLVYGLYFGTLLALAFYNLVLFIYTREPIYGWYVGYVICTAFVLAFGNGIGQSTIWPNRTGNNTELSFVGTGGIALAMTGFAYSFLGLGKRYAIFNKLNIVIFTLISTLLVLLILPSTHHSEISPFLYFLFALQLLSIFTVSIIEYIKFRGVTIYLLLGYIFLFPAILISMLKFAGLLASSALANHSFEASFLLEAFILSLGVGAKIMQLKNSELQAVEDLKNNEQKFLQNMMSVREAEKQELGIILHNSVAQNLAVVRTRLNKFKLISRKPEEVSQLINFIDDTTAEIRGISHQSYPHYLEQFGLSNAAAHYAESNLDEREIDWRCNIGTFSFSEETNLILYRVIQESINNIYRHARASMVRLGLQRNGHLFILTIEDDGRGIHNTNEGFGIASIRQYTSMLNGRLEIIDNPNGGTLIKLEFPQPRSNQEHGTEI